MKTLELAEQALAASGVPIADARIGHVCRLVGEDVPNSMSNALGIVSKIAGDILTVQLGEHTYLKVSSGSVDFHVGSKPEAPADAILDCRKVTLRQKEACLREFNGILAKTYETSSLLEDVEFIAGLQEIRLRLFPSSMTDRAQGLFVWLPALNQAAIQVYLLREANPQDWQPTVDQLLSNLDAARAPTGELCILVPIHGAQPEHYTLLVLSHNKPDDPFQVKYFETLCPESVNCRANA